MKKLLTASLLLASLYSSVVSADELACPTKTKAKKAIERAVIAKVSASLSPTITITSIKAKIRQVSAGVASGAIVIDSNLYGFGLTSAYDATTKKLTVTAAGAEVVPTYCSYEVQGTVKLKGTTGTGETFERLSLSTNIEKFVVKVSLANEGKVVKK